MSKPAGKEWIFLALVRAGYLKVDNKGIVWRVAERGGTSWFRSIEPRPMKSLDRCGYVRLSTRVNGRSISCKAHRLVWLFFNGPIPSGMEINHINGIKRDNRPCNLEIVTNSDNKYHAFRNNLREIKRGEMCSYSILNDSAVRDIRKRWSDGEGLSVLAQEYGVKYHTVYSAVHHTSWRHI